MTLHDTEESTPQTAPAPVRPPVGPGFSMKPAMIVLGLAVLILGVFIVAGILTSSPVQTTKTDKAPSAVPGSSVRALPAAPDLSVITASGQPPSNILNAVSIPTGAVRISHQNNSAASDQYDAQIGLRSDDSQGALQAFYARDMKRQGWQIFEQGPADHDPGGTEVLGKLAGSDGFYWEMGAVISRTTFGPHDPPAGLTDFTIRLFQVPDPD
jgi:hypothetical protein